MKNNKISIGYFIGDNSPGMGGAASYSQRLAASLLKHDFRSGIDFEIIEPNPLSRVSSSMSTIRNRFMEAIDVLTFKGPIESRVRYKRSCSKRFRKHNLIHVPFQTPPRDVGCKPFIITMHDVQELHFPEYFSAEERASRGLENLFAIRNAKAVVVSYEHVKRDLIRLFKCDEGRIFVAPLPIAECVLPAPTEEQSRTYSLRHSSKGKFILYPAQTWQHKNHLRLIEAYEYARRKAKTHFSLVCAGHKNDFYQQVIASRVAASPFSDSIFFTGGLSVPWEPELRWLYENALGVVIPSMYEAGSFPLIEAMSLGTPVICSDTTSLPDTIGNRHFVFPSNDCEKMAEAILKLIEDTTYRSENRSNSLIRMKNLIAENAAPFYEDMWLRISKEFCCVP
jgi:glycosyltransferase involved in cell wall biosynthesis